MRDIQEPTGQTPHKTGASAGVAAVTTIAPPEYAKGMMITARAFAVRITFDGSTPDPAAPNGLVIPAGVAPVRFPFAKTIKFCSDVVGASALDVLYLC